MVQPACGNRLIALIIDKKKIYSISIGQTALQLSQDMRSSQPALSLTTTDPKMLDATICSAAQVAAEFSLMKGVE